MLFAMIRGPSDGVMVPIPQYPLYSASIALYGGELVPYYLDEQNGWGLDMNELTRALNAARARGNNMRMYYRDDEMMIILGLNSSLSISNHNLS